jgi:hypothetical protein
LDTLRSQSFCFTDLCAADSDCTGLDLPSSDFGALVCLGVWPKRDRSVARPFGHPSYVSLQGMQFDHQRGSREI